MFNNYYYAGNGGPSPLLTFTIMQAYYAAAY